MFVDRQNKKPAKFVDFFRPNAAEVWIKIGETTSFGIRNSDAKSEIRMKWRWALSNVRDFNTIYERLHGVDDKRAILKNECLVAPGTCARCFYLHM